MEPKELKKQYNKTFYERHKAEILDERKTNPYERPIQYCAICNCSFKYPTVHKRSQKHQNALLLRSVYLDDDTDPIFKVENQ